MWTSSSEKALAKFLSIGAAVTSLFVWTASGTDPVNVTKLWIAGGTAGAGIAIVAFLYKSKVLKESKWLIAAAIFFVIAMVNSMIQSRAPFDQTMYGVYGRNTGTLTYLILLSLMLATSMLKSQRSFKSLLNSVLMVGTLNVFYCGWVLIFGDFIPWNNQYQSILGTFGNPDFISAFLGLYVVLIISQLVGTNYKLTAKLTGAVLGLLALLEIIKSHAIQGLVVTAGGIVIFGFFFIRSKTKNGLIVFTYISGSILLGFLAVLGTLQKGPLSFVYKKSVSLRGSYWHAGIEMGKKHPFSGVGMDTYGDWYRATRPPVAFIDTPPPSVVSNVAHNVVIDLFAFGGWPLLLSYLMILGLGIVALAKVIIRNTTYDPIFVGLASLWICFQAQSIISINQIGLAIWGWIATGALIAYEKSSDPKSNLKDVISTSTINKKIARREAILSANLIGGIGLLIGLIVSYPPMSADIKWRAALDSRELAKLEASLVPSYMNPASSTRYAQAIATLRNSNLNDLALRYAKEAIKFNPDSTDAWQQLYLISTSSDLERERALQNLKRLDPNNPDLLGLVK